MGSIQKSEGLFGMESSMVSGKLSVFGAVAVVLLAATVSNAAVDTVRVNCGGSAYTAANGTQWAADSGFTGGQIYSEPGTTIANTADQTLHQYERWDSQDFAYNFNLIPGSYIVNLYEASLYANVCNAGGRVFDVTINGTKVLTNYDMYNEVNGCLIAHVKSFVVATTDGRINITFNVGAAENPKINAIEIVPGTVISISGASKAIASRFTVAASSGTLTVLSQAEGAYSLELKDLQGKRIDTRTGFGNGSQSFTNLRPGVYFLTSVSGGESVTRTISVLR
jgi:hypothetical protein